MIKAPDSPLYIARAIPTSIRTLGLRPARSITRASARSIRSRNVESRFMPCRLRICFYLWKTTFSGSPSTVFRTDLGQNEEAPPQCSHVFRQTALYEGRNRLQMRGEQK